MNNTTKSMLGAAAIGLTIAVAAGSAGFASDGQNTLTYRGFETPRDAKVVDVRPKGESTGDRFLASLTLRKAGAIAGRLEVECTAVDGTYEGHMCTLVAIVEEGTLTFQSVGIGRRIPNVGMPPEVYAVTGGTGLYAGAGGTMTVEPVARGERITIDLR
jgi:hypothetical protein